MKLLVLNNLDSGFANASVYDFLRSLARPGDEIVIRNIDSESDFESALAGARSFDCVVVSGGDGTHSSACYILRNSSVPVLLYPSGTANLLSLNLELPEDPPALAQLLLEGRTLDFDIGQIEAAGKSMGFMMIAGCGYDADIMTTAKHDKKLLGPIAYFKAALENPTPQQSHLVLDIDGKTVEADGVGVLFLNFAKIQFDITIGTENRPRDGMLDVLILNTSSAWDLLLPALGVAIDRTGTVFEHSEQFLHYRGRKISVTADPPLRIQFDGDTSEHLTPFTAQVLPGAARLVVDDDGYERFKEG